MAQAGEPESTVLVVDDNAEVCELFSDILGMLGHRVTCARNGQDALDYLNAHPAPALILLDLNMPVMNGWEFRRRQRADPRLAEIPVVVVSAINDLAQGGDRMEAAEHLTKPVDLRTLIGVIGRLGGHERPAGSRARRSVH
jgi:CheY-like chemotaxis protein